MFVIDVPGNQATMQELAQIDTFNEKLQAEGKWITAAGIAGADAALLIDNRVGSQQLEEKSLVTGVENYTGFWIIEADSNLDATQLAKDASEACNRRVELRPYLR